VIIRRALVVALTPGSYTVAFQPQSGPTLDTLIDNVAPDARLEQWEKAERTSHMRRQNVYEKMFAPKQNKQFFRS
jgi:hypothetical protein